MALTSRSLARALGALLLLTLTAGCSRGPTFAAFDAGVGEELDLSYLRGQQQLLAGEFAKAEESLRASLASRPSARAHHALGDALLAQARLADAEENFAHAVRLEPGKAISWMRLGQTRRAANLHAKALEAFRRAGELLPADPEPRRAAAEALVELGRADEAIAQWTEAASKGPRGAAGDFQRIGELHAAAGRYPEAVAAFERAVKLGEDAGSWMALGDARVRAGDLPGAAKAYVRAGTLDPKDPIAWELIAEIRLKGGDLAGAREAFAASLKAKPRAEPHLGLGRIALQEGREGEAHRELALAIEAATGETASELREIAQFAGRLGAWDKAEPLLAQLAKEPEGAEDPELLRELERARRALGRAPDDAPVARHE